MDGKVEMIRARFGLNHLHRLVFTSDGVVVGVIIGSVERYQLVKIKPTESEAEHRFRSWLCCRLRSIENQIVGVGSRSGRISQSRRSISGLVICWFFSFCFRLRQSSLYWFISDGVVTESEEIKTFWFFQLWFRRFYDSAYDSDFRFSLGHKHKRSYDSVASEKQPSMLACESDNLVCFLSLQWFKKKAKIPQELVMKCIPRSRSRWNLENKFLRS